MRRRVWRKSIGKGVVDDFSDQSQLRRGCASKMVLFSICGRLLDGTE